MKIRKVDGLILLKIYAGIDSSHEPNKVNNGRDINRTTKNRFPENKTQFYYWNVHVVWGINLNLTEVIKYNFAFSLTIKKKTKYKYANVIYK